mmetsp:Transcript_75634/g.130989  ORF Transcript_75634/g.130989 Transcript_75634/m.130989 type:complete len:243 (-) Transcript_75634:26-754(-)
MSIEGTSHVMTRFEVCDGEVVLVRRSISKALGTFVTRNNWWQGTRKILHVKAHALTLVAMCLALCHDAMRVYDCLLLPSFLQHLIFQDSDSYSNGAPSVSCLESFVHLVERQQTVFVQDVISTSHVCSWQCLCPLATPQISDIDIISCALANGHGETTVSLAPFKHLLVDIHTFCIPLRRRVQFLPHKLFVALGLFISFSLVVRLESWRCNVLSSHSLTCKSGVKMRGQLAPKQEKGRVPTN